MPTFARRSAVVERLRRLLFTPSKLLTVGALALTFATADAALAQTSGVVVGTLANRDYNVADYADSTLDLTGARYDINTTYDSTITLGGGTLKLSTGTSGPVYDAENETLYMRGLFKYLDVLTPEEEQACAQYHSYYEWYYDGPISRYVEVAGHHIDASAGGEIYVSNTFNQNFDMPSYVQDTLGVYMNTQKIDGSFVKSGEGTLTLQTYEVSLDADGQPQTVQIGKTQVAGDLTVNGGTLNIFGEGDYQNVRTESLGMLYLDCGSHTINGNFENNGYALLAYTPDADGAPNKYVVMGDLNNTGALYNYSVLQLTSGNHHITGTLQNNGYTNFYGGTYSIDGSITNNGIITFTEGSHAIKGNGYIQNDYMINNYGKLYIAGTETDASDGFTINGGTFVNYGDTGLIHGSSTIASTCINYGYLTLLNGNHTIDGRVDNQGTLSFHDGNHTVTGYIINGAINSPEATLYFIGSNTVIEGTIYNYGNVHFGAGRHTVNSIANIQGNVYAISEDDASAPAIFTNRITSVEGRWYSWGNVEYQGDLTIQNGYATFGRNTYGQGQNTFHNGTRLLLEQSIVDANASCLGVEVQLSADSDLRYSNIIQGMETGENNAFYLTYNEYRIPTFLEWNAGRNNIATAISSNNIINKAIYSEKGSNIGFFTFGKENVEVGKSVNGYTVVIDSNSEDLFQHHGDTAIYNAFVTVAGNTNFGVKDNNYFVVYGESYRLLSAENGQYEWEVDSSGMLGFYRNGETAPNLAPSITSNLVIFHEGGGYNKPDESVDYTNGARIWLDTVYRDKTGAVAQVDHKLGAIHAGHIIFGYQTQVWYDGISSVASNVEMTFDLDAEKSIQYGDTNAFSNGDDSALHEATKEEIESVFGAAQLVDATFTQTSANSAAGVVTVRAKDVADYAAEQNMSERERELAAKLDGARLEEGRALGFYDALYNEADQGKVRQTIHNLSLLGYNMLNAQGHFGNPTSSFFGGSSVSGEAKRGQPAERDWDSLDLNQQTQESVVEQTTYEPKRSLWAAYAHTSVDGDDYEFGGVTTRGYELRRDGVIGGVRRQIDATTSAGLFFGVSSPEIQSANDLEGGYGVVGSQMEMTDFQFAGHFEKVLADVWELAVYVGGGSQSMDWERFADFGPDAGGLYRYEAEGTGNTVTGTIYLSYRADVGDALVLRPTIGVDSEHSWLYGFSETATVANAGSASVLLNPYMDMFAQSYSYTKTYYNRNTARAGVSLAYSDPRHGLVGLNGRVFYGYKLGGDDAPELTYYSDAYRWEDMASHEMGAGSLNVGGGGFIHLNPIKTLTATGDVNAIWYKNAQTFNVTGGVSYRF